jgi:hypothetical protein
LRNLSKNETSNHKHQAPNINNQMTKTKRRNLKGLLFRTLEFGALVTLWFQQVPLALKPSSVTMEFGIWSLGFYLLQGQFYDL